MFQSSLNTARNSPSITTADIYSTSLSANTANRRLFDLTLVQSNAVAFASQQADAAKNKALDTDAPPPLDSITANTSDDDSVSTIGSNASTTPHRSLFSRYWQMTGQEPGLLRRRSYQHTSIQQPSTPPPVFEEDEAVDVDVDAPASSAVSSVTSVVSRRSIMPLQAKASRSFSVPSLQSIDHQTPYNNMASSSSSSQRKYASSSQLNLSSCLRESRFSPGSSKRRASTSGPIQNNNTSSSVRFDLETIRVQRFEKPQETYAEKGWDKQFC
jgi:hypothetical protein